MINRNTKLRWRRRLKKHQRQIEGIGYQTEENIDKHLFRRLGRLYEVRRFVASWVLLVVALTIGVVIQTRALGDYYLSLGPASGGIFSEGAVGSYTNSNPIFASNDVNATVSRLLFSGLLTYDHDGLLIGDLAEDWAVDESGKRYTVKLRSGLKWHDDEPLTSEDVAFTIRTIQNPDTRSPHFSAWQGVKVEVPHEAEIIFELPNVLASFPHSLTLGILPKHKLQGLKYSELRSSLFNTVQPVGSGPFEWKDAEVVGDTVELREQRIALSAYENYHRGRPKIDEFIVRAFLDEEQLKKSFNEGKLNAIAGSLSSPLEGRDVEELNIPLAGSVSAFFNTQSTLLSDAAVRRALTVATDKKSLLKQLSYSSIESDGPLLSEHIGYNPDLAQYGYDVEKAKSMLDEAGWPVEASSGIRTKEGAKLSIAIKTLSSAEYATVANQLQKQWSEIGVEVKIDSLAQNVLQPTIDARDYDVLVYGIIMGQDADQFAYWHSTQSDVLSQRRLNFSNYKSSQVDEALIAGRTRLDPDLRKAKYATFLQSWREDAPAIALYRPRFIYTVYGTLYGFDENGFNSPIDRLNNVHEWMIRNERTILE